MIDIKKMFVFISPRYDLLNHILSFGLDFYWRYRMVYIASNYLFGKKVYLLDIAGGTGDVAFAFTKLKNLKIAVISDFCLEMLRLAKIKSKKYKFSFSFSCTDGENINFKNNTFNLVTNAFALRNIKNLERAFSEMKRILNPGGFCMSLEFARPENVFFKPFFYLYLNYILPLMGAIISSNYDAYKYLSSSIQEFMTPKEVCELLKKSGFKNVHSIPLTFGIVVIYIGEA